MIDRLDPSLFDWSTWRAGSIVELAVAPSHRTDVLVQYKTNIRKYAIGYCDASSLICRPKIDHKAVMFFVNNIQFWTHL